MKILPALGLALFLGCASPQNQSAPESQQPTENAHPCDFSSLGEAVQSLYQAVQEERYLSQDNLNPGSKDYVHEFPLSSGDVQSRLVAMPEQQSLLIGNRPLNELGLPSILAYFPTVGNPEEYVMIYINPEGEILDCAKTPLQNLCA